MYKNARNSVHSPIPEIVDAGAAAVKVRVTHLIHRGVPSDYYLNSST
jgi:hypothetical protein